MSPNRVVLIDPDPAVKVLARRLRAQEYEVSVFDSGEEGTRSALENPPAVVIADLWMEGVSGLQIARLLGAEPATEDVPVVLRSPVDEPRTRFWARHAGAAGYVAKGRFGELVRTLKRVVRPRDDGFFFSLGDGADAPWIVIGTHYDTKILGPEHGETPDRPFLGANDGGSGTAIQLELARVLSQDERPREVGLRLLFLDGEEAVNFDWEGKDNTYGSRYHAERLLREGEASRFGACVILDMLGDRDLQLVHDVNSRLALLEIFQDAARREGLGKHLMTQRQAVRDDHQSFLRVGIPAVDLIDLTYGPNNGWWHTVEDTLDKCSADSLGVAARIFLAGLPDLEAWVLDQR